MTFKYCNSLENSRLANMKKSGKDKCNKCDIEFKQGDKCWHNETHKTVWYHKICYEKMLY